MLYSLSPSPHSSSFSHLMSASLLLQPHFMSLHGDCQMRCIPRKTWLRTLCESAILPLDFCGTSSQPCRTTLQLVSCAHGYVCLNLWAAQPENWISPITSSRPPNPGSQAEPSRPHRGDAMAWHPMKIRGSAGSGELGSGKGEPQHISPLPGGAGSVWGRSQRQRGGKWC